MGIKAVKDYLKTNLIVSFKNGFIHIGPGHHADRIKFHVKTCFVLHETYCEGSEENRVIATIIMNPKLLSALYRQTDNYENLVNIYTYRNDQILKMYCEKPCWPNTTICGDIIYDNTYSTDRNVTIRRAIGNAEAGLNLTESEIMDCCEQLKELNKDRFKYKQSLQQLRKELDIASNQP